MEPTLGEIRMFAGNFNPISWALCEGQLLPINSNQSLYSLLGTTYGGDGITTFGLPDLRGRMAISAGQGPGLSSTPLGQKSGTTEISLTQSTMPSHSHTLNSSSSPGTASTPLNSFPAMSKVQVERGGVNQDVSSYGTPSNSTQAANAIGNTGGNIPVNVQNPYLGINYIICLVGIFPSRN
jgi:microcystin-dependent protein